MFDAGRLRDRITIRRKVETKNATGALDIAWITLADDLSAEIVSLNGREALVASVLMGISTFQITVRFRDDIKASDQVLYRDRELNIVAPPEDRLGTRQWLVIHASNQAPQGA